MRFLVDAQLPPALARWLGEHGHSAAPAVVWLRIGNCTNRVLFAWLEPLLPEIARQLESGQRLVEVRRDKLPGQ
jgi:predicted nuclease of predicted toxin-antitoxin system